MANVTHDILDSIGYPSSYPIIESIRNTGFSAGDYSFDAKGLLSDKLQRAILLLFDAMKDIQEERLARGASFEDSRGMIIFDELDDLIRYDRLGSCGGDVIFNLLVNQISMHVINVHRINFVVARSSSYITHSFSSTSMSDFRWSVFEMTDLPREAILPILRRGKYTVEQVNEIMDVVGTRFGYVYI
jgi:hypothetical protein